MLVTSFHIIKGMSDYMNSIIAVLDFFAASIAGGRGQHKLLGILFMLMELKE
jgi:hypothetical protein